MASNNEDTMTTDITTIKRHELYYFQDGLIFLVENVLFKIPRYMLALQSSFFGTLFSLPRGSSVVEGSTDADPIVIQQVTSLDFERLLALLHPLTLEYGSFTDKWAIDEWQSILRLATMWEIDQARTLAIQYLSKVLSPIDKVIFGRQYDCPTWVKEGFTVLCLRPNFLPVDEARRLDQEDLWKYGVVRERIRSKLIKPLDRDLSGEWTDFRGGSTYVRTGIYEDGMLYRHDPMVQELIEDYFIGSQRRI